MNTVIQKYPNGTIFFMDYPKGRKYWKIIGTYGTILTDIGPTYRVIRCSKKGKEFRDTNGFIMNYIDRELENPEYQGIGLVGQSEVGTKAGRAGALMGKTKHRITYLENEMKSHTRELIALKKGLFQINLDQGAI